VGEVERGKRGDVHVSAGTKVSWLLLRLSGVREERFPGSKIPAGTEVNLFLQRSSTTSLERFTFQ